MNTLLTKEQFAAYREQYLVRAHNKTLTPADIIIYNIVRGKSPRCGFTAITNTNKLNCCAFDKWQGFLQPKSHLMWITRTIPEADIRFHQRLSISALNSTPTSRAERFCKENALPYSVEFIETFRTELNNYDN